MTSISQWRRKWKQRFAEDPVLSEELVQEPREYIVSDRWRRKADKLVEDAAASGCDASQVLEAKDLIRQLQEVAREEKVEQERSVEEYLDEDDRFVPRRLAEDIKEDYTFVTMRDNKTIYIYDSDAGCYKENGESCIREEVERRLVEECSRRKKKEVFSSIRDTTYMDRRDFCEPAHLINVENGVYNLKEDRLKEHGPSYLFSHQLPVVYDSDADCPRIKEFLHEVVREEDVKLIQELAGYCLYRAYPIQKAFMFIGEGSNGKSTLISLLQAFLGRENVANIPLQEFERNRFATARLDGKLANMDADLPDQALRSTGMFKRLTGGDRIYADVKFKEPFEFRNTAKLIFSANKVPEAYDDTTAFFRRWVFISFPYTFTDKDDEHPDKDPNILDELTTDEELSGFLNWALEGLERLLSNGRFSHSKGAEEIREQYRKLSSPIKGFVDAHVESDPDNEIPKERFYDVFAAYCRDAGLPVPAKQTVTKKLKQEVDVEQTRPKIDGKRTRCWKGVKLVGVQAVQDVQGDSHLSPSQESSTLNKMQKRLDTVDGSDRDTRSGEDSRSESTRSGSDKKDVLKAIKDLGGTPSGNPVAYSAVIDYLDLSEREIETVINRLLRKGVCHEPKPGKVKVV